MDAQTYKIFPTLNIFQGFWHKVWNQLQRSSKIGLSNGALWNEVLFPIETTLISLKCICCCLISIVQSNLYQLRVLLCDIKLKYDILSGITTTGIMLLCLCLNILKYLQKTWCFVGKVMVKKPTELVDLNICTFYYFHLVLDNSITFIQYYF